MKTKSDLEKILSQASYWKEGVNNLLYNTVLDYMQVNSMNRTHLAEYLGISKGRVSQILNDGELNFSIEKLFSILIKLGKYPDFKVVDIEQFHIDNSVRKPNVKSKSNDNLINRGIVI